MTKLDDIIQTHRNVSAQDSRNLDVLMSRAMDTPAPRNFGGALDSPGLSIIAEIKRRSPSAGDLALDLNPTELAQQYVAGGASCLSVLTDTSYFGGSEEDLQRARSAVNIPVLRKDFTVDARDIADARMMGADAVLLIVAALSDQELKAFNEIAYELALTAIFEVHDEAEIARAANVGADVIGINQRNLNTFEIEPDLALRLAPKLPIGVVKVAESGIKTSEEVARFADSGFDAILVGSSFVTASDVSEAVRALVEAGQGG